jgi:hypothetical protein
MTSTSVSDMTEMANLIIEHYEHHAHDWDADRNRHIGAWNDKPWHDRFTAALPAAATVLDFGCGSGFRSRDTWRNAGFT